MSEWTLKDSKLGDRYVDMIGDKLWENLGDHWHYLRATTKYDHFITYSFEPMTAKEIPCSEHCIPILK